MHRPNRTSAMETVLLYHEQTKHHSHRYAASLGYLDWATQPNPFRRYHGAPLIKLDEVPPERNARPYDELFTGSNRPVQPIGHRLISQLFYDSLALSAWKTTAESRWSLRVNPSSGNLHPTEGYLVAGPIEKLGSEPAMYHYAPYEHALERRAKLTDDLWRSLSHGLPEEAFLVGLTSVYWRESWKYGERAFRYCMHDVGHAIGAIAIAATVLGWKIALLEMIDDEALSQLLGVHDQSDIEAEHADVLMAVYPGNATFDMALRRTYDMPAIHHTNTFGQPNPLSHGHHAWPIIDRISDATVRAAAPGKCFWRVDLDNGPAPQLLADHREGAARQIIRQRRSAVAMDRRTIVDAETFYLMLQRTVPPTANLVFDALPWPPKIALALFVHRVAGLEAGLYLLVRDAAQEPFLRQSIEGDFVWQTPPQCPDHLTLYLLKSADYQSVSRTIACHQDIAADSAFSVSMLAHFKPQMTSIGPWFYKRLFWETGIIGQLLYLEAEAAGIRSTGIGCFFDDKMHELLGLRDCSWQDLYHFTVGGAVDDPRLQTLQAYEHLQSEID